MLARALERNGDLTEVRLRAPDLAQRLESLRARLSDPGAGLSSPAGFGEGAGDLRRLTEQWDSTLEEVRGIKGLTDFLRPPDLTHVSKVVSPGAAIVINISDYGSHALIVAEAGVRPIPLPDLSAEKVMKQVATLYAAVEAAHDQQRPLSASLVAQESLKGVLRWLWRTIAAPVLDALPKAEQPAETPQRVWWCLTGFLSLLPLHAAGDVSRGPHASVLDQVVSSYTPTLRTVTAARTRPAPQRDAGTPVLTVSLSQTAEGTFLPGADRVAWASAGSHGKHLANAQATRQRVSAELPRHPRVLFACHAVADPVRPSRSHVRLHDGPLALAEILQLRLARAELALLPMCETARGGVALADEALHLAAAFHLAGFRDVLGSLWLIADGTAAEATERLASLLADAPEGQATSVSDGSARSPALALHHAVRAARQEDPDAPSLWAPLIHVGA